MDIFIIILLISLGIIAFLLEIFLIPGISIAGISGIIFLISGIIYAFKINTLYGYYAIFVSLVSLVLSIYYFMKSKTLDKLSLHTEIEGKVASIDKEEIQLGDRGITISRLAPMGKVKIKDRQIEAKALYDFIDEEEEIEVIEVNETNVSVRKVT